MTEIYVYKLIDPSTNKPFYIGKGTGARMLSHERYCNKTYETTTHNNRLLKNKIKKVLRESGQIRYQKHYTTEHNAFSIERALINKYGRRDNKTGILCNMTNGGEGVSGHVRNEEWREQSRQRQIQRSKGYDQYTKQGEFVSSFNTLDDLRHQYPHIDAGSLSMCVNHKIKSTIGFRWTWKDHPLQRWNPARKPRECCRYRGRQVNQYDKTGDFIATFPSLAVAAVSVNKHPNTILECCKGRSKTAGGYVWYYAD